MVRCLVAHPDLTTRGGAEAVSMNVLEALAPDHEVALVTITEPDLAALNDFFDTTVSGVTVRRTDALPRLLSGIAGNRFNTMTTALFNRSVRRIEGEYDLVVSTYNEQALARPSVLYVHHSNFDRSTLPDAPGRDSAVYAVYDRLCAAVSGIDRADFRDSRVLANSEWTATRVERTLGVPAEVVYPPVATEPLAARARPWDEREEGFVTIGRIGPDKRMLRTIRVIDRLRERGHDVHLHVVGGAFDGDYARRVRRAGRKRPHVYLEGAVSRDRLVDLVTTHRYGIHGKDSEHFGMAVAELVAGGAVPFVPDDGGQCEVVGGDSRLTYDDAEGAVERIDRVLDDPSLQQALRRGLPDVEARFGRERFQREIRRIVTETAPAAPQLE